ncbi:MAG: metal ABC transporter permease [Candidatus Thiodiazotropha endolucinida]|uniref:Manganese transport system membrane protein MntB n=2 Tax=Candidatus Thiodiazotropha TaxID=1913444 RepID=A0A7Z0VL64_9GAMM|nr:metal ABC transporter permease [Candidatus Thiodiazotropha endolucinida]MBT3040229.1 metal ABC transporter permease [Candidatus Thiodiazotropha sp. (ex Codakia orbicularis)]MBV2125911.1 metal ABC transporter permease [Candidatus Thiodiazotropha taylori]MCG7978391.1 metal ABC transporter permease [Candidatus Thiodiazotropha taylori]MCW4236522.1 metal ABC transporter permease [Candidatus Thiodiazotropha endolucinida]ODJ87585.1 manganese transport system membrane protein MntB [Candidatus Thiod
MYDAIFAPFVEFSFMRRALVGCLALSLGATPIGVFLTLRRMSLTGDAMAHAILPGAALGYLVAGLSLGAMTLGGVIAGVAVAILSGLVARTTVAREDSSLAAFYLISLAVGVVIVSMRGSNVDLLHILFGTVLALNDEAIFLISGIATITLFGLAVIYRPLVIECFDPGFLRSVSPLSPVAHYGFLVLAVLNLVGGFHALGTLMAVGIMILPAAAARFWTRDITHLLIIGVLGAFLSGFVGLLLSYHASLPSGPAIILTAGAFYLLSLAFGPDGVIMTRLRPRRHLEA